MIVQTLAVTHEPSWEVGGSLHELPFQEGLEELEDILRSLDPIGARHGFGLEGRPANALTCPALPIQDAHLGSISTKDILVPKYKEAPKLRGDGGVSLFGLLGKESVRASFDDPVLLFSGIERVMGVLLILRAISPACVMKTNQHRFFELDREDVDSLSLVLQSSLSQEVGEADVPDARIPLTLLAHGNTDL